MCVFILCAYSYVYFLQKTYLSLLCNKSWHFKCEKKVPLTSFIFSEAKPFNIDGTASAAHGIIDCVFSLQQSETGMKKHRRKEAKAASFLKGSKDFTLICPECFPEEDTAVLRNEWNDEKTLLFSSLVMRKIFIKAKFILGKKKKAQTRRYVFRDAAAVRGWWKNSRC